MTESFLYLNIRVLNTLDFPTSISGICRQVRKSNILIKMLNFLLFVEMQIFRHDILVDKSVKVEKTVQYGIHILVTVYTLCTLICG